jgi:hypothetical protein
VALWKRDPERADAESDPGVVSIPPADGHHYADNHPWGAKEQTALLTQLEQLEQSMPEPGVTA